MKIAMGKIAFRLDADLSKSLQELDYRGIWLQDMLGLLAGLRPMIRFGSGRKENVLLQHICQRKRLKMLVG